MFTKIRARILRDEHQLLALGHFAFLFLFSALIMSGNLANAGADLSTNITVDQPQVIFGNDGVFHITCTNNGPDTAQAVRLEVSAWHMFAWENMLTVETSNGTIEPLGPNPMFPHDGKAVVMGSLAPGESVQVTARLKSYLEGSEFRVDPGSQELFAKISSSTGDSTSSNNEASATVNFFRTALISYTVPRQAYGISPDYDPYPISGKWYLNQPILYETTFYNVGIDAATTVTLSYSITPGLSDVEVDLITSGVVTGVVKNGSSYSIGYVAPDATVTLTVRAKTTQTGEQGVLADISVPVAITTTPSVQVRNVLAIYDEPVPPLADLSFTVVPDSEQVKYGDNAVIRINITNKGPAAVDNVLLQYRMFLGGAQISMETTAGEIVELQDLLNLIRHVKIARMEPSQSETVTITLSKIDLGTVVNFFDLTSDSSTIDPVSDNSDFFHINFVSHFDLEVTAAVSPASVQPGGTLVYTATVTNNGPDPVPGVYLSNIWRQATYDNGVSRYVFVERPGLELIRFYSSGPWELNLTVLGLSAKLPVLAPNESATLTLVYRVQGNIQGDESGNIVNTFGVRYPEQDADTSNNVMVMHTPIVAQGSPGADLQVTQMASANAASIDQPYTYTITGMNHGSQAVAGAHIGVQLPDGGVIQSATSDKGTIVTSGNYVELSNLALAAGELVNITVGYAPTEHGVLTSVANIAAEVFDPNLANNQAVASTTVNDPGACSNAVDLSANITRVRTKTKLQKKLDRHFYSIQAQVEIATEGTECAPSITAKLFLSTDPVLDNADILLATTPLKKSPCPGRKPVKVKFKLKNLEGDYLNPLGKYLIAVADGDNVIIECDEADNRYAVHNQGR